MNLVQLNKDIFLDINELALVRFEDTDQNVSAILRFRNGDSETISGEVARNLHLELCRSQSSDESPQTEPLDRLGEGAVSEQSASLVGLSLIMPQVGRNKTWFYRTDETGRGFFLAFVNAKGSCSLRTFDADRGIRLNRLYRTGDYQREFADLINGATELTVTRQPNLERDCKARLPETLLAHLRKQIG